MTVGDECITAGSCLGIAPRHFATGDDGRTHPARGVIEADDAVLDTAVSCPVEAIRLHDAATGEPIEP